MSTRTIDQLLDHIQKSVAQIVSFTDGMPEAEFERDERTQLACCKAIETIGEACGCLSRDHGHFTQSEPSIKWKAWKGMRNFTAHQYDRIDWSIVWNTIRRDVPELEALVKQIRDRDLAHLQARHQSTTGRGR